MNTDKTVSIIMGTYNGAEYIREQLDSILSQTYPLKEIIIQDDGSTDDTVAICTAYAEKYPIIHFSRKAAYGKDVVTAFIQLNGATVGAVANRSEIYGEDGTVKEKMDGTLSARGAKKAADFVNFCDAFCIPVLTITNVTGFKATKCSERTMAKNAAALTAAFANATVPKVNVVVGKAYGSAYVVMNSKSIGADMVFAWPNAEIGMMDAKSAAKIMYEGSDAATINEKAAEYATLQNNVTSAARRGYVDTIIEPEDTRKYVIGAFEMLYTKREDRPDRKHGTV